MKITFIRNGSVAIATGMEFYEKVKDGATFTADVKIVRCPLFHRKFWALLRVVLHNLPEALGFKTVDSLKEELLFRAGYFKKYTTTKGEEIYKVESISYEHLDQLQFQELYNRVFDEAVALLGVVAADLGREIEEFS
jgi:hypothetical protein